MGGDDAGDQVALDVGLAALDAAQAAVLGLSDDGDEVRPERQRHEPFLFAELGVELGGDEQAGLHGGVSVEARTVVG